MKALAGPARTIALLALAPGLALGATPRAGLVPVLGPPGAAVQESLERRYEELVRRYQVEDPEAAVQAFLAWSSDALDQLRAASRRAEHAAYEQALPGLSRFDTRRLAAAVMLSTEAIHRGAPPEGHLNLASYCIRGLAGRPDSAVFLRNWKVVMASWFLATGRPLDAEELASAGDRDAEAMLLQASVAEGIALRPAPASGSPIRPSDYRGASPRALLQRAEQKYREAIRLAPSLVEARIRLGRLLAREAKPREARQLLSEARATAPDGYLSYLAALFLGGLNESEGRVAEARACYEAALREYPESQTAYLALGHLLESSGETTEGWNRVTRMFAGSQDPERDPWWVYLDAQFWQMDRRLAEMRRFAREPQ